MLPLLKYCTPVVLFILLFPGSSCKKETVCTGVPVVTVNFQANLNLGAQQLNSPGNNEVFTGYGYANNGVMIYRYTQTQFLAFDCTCPYDGSSNTRAVVSASSVSSLYATCPVCGSSFLLSTGAPNKGPSTCPLKQYTAIYDATNNVVNVQN